MGGRGGLPQLPRMQLTAAQKYRYYRSSEVLVLQKYWYTCILLVLQGAAWALPNWVKGPRSEEVSWVTKLTPSPPRPPLLGLCQDGGDQEEDAGGRHHHQPQHHQQHLERGFANIKLDKKDTILRHKCLIHHQCEFKVFVNTIIIAQYHLHHLVSAVDEDWERQRLRSRGHLWGGLQVR